MNAVSSSGISIYPLSSTTVLPGQRNTGARPLAFGADVPPVQTPADTVSFSLKAVEKVRTLGEVAFNKEQQIIVPSAAMNLACALRLPPERLETLLLASGVYNMGKDPVNNPAWQKAGPLTPDEQQSIQQYPLGSVNKMMALSAEKRREGRTAEANQLDLAIPIVLAHKYNFAGGGYPGQAIQGDQIPIEAQILGLVDAYYAMISQRPYRPAMTPQAALQTLQSEAGSKWDPRLVEVFTRKVQ